MNQSFAYNEVTSVIIALLHAEYNVVLTLMYACTSDVTCRSPGVLLSMSGCITVDVRVYYCRCPVVLLKCNALGVNNDPGEAL